MTGASWRLLPLALAACASTTPAPAVEQAEPQPITLALNADGSLELSADAEAARATLGPIAIDSCVGYLKDHPDSGPCTWVTEAGPTVAVKADGTTTFRVEPGNLQSVGAWTVGDATLPFLIGAARAGVELAWDHAPRPEGVDANTRSVLQMTKEAPRAGLLLGTDKVIHGFTQGSMAPAAGLQEGDIVASLNGDASLAEDARTFVSNLPKKAGQVARIGVTRDGEPIEVELTMRAHWQCHRVWSDSAQPSVVDEPTGPSVEVACPPWAPSVVSAG